MYRTRKPNPERSGSDDLNWGRSRVERVWGQRGGTQDGQHYFSEYTFLSSSGFRDHINVPRTSKRVNKNGRKP